MTVLVLIFAALAAFIHFYIFALETFLWTSGAARKTFGLTESEAQQTKSLAANQGIYNAALAAMTIVGIVFVLTGDSMIGITLIIAGTASMVVAATYLFLTSDKKGAAAKQAAFPILTIVAIALSSVMG